MLYEQLIEETVDSILAEENILSFLFEESRNKDQIVPAANRQSRKLIITGHALDRAEERHVDRAELTASVSELTKTLPSSFQGVVWVGLGPSKLEPEVEDLLSHTDKKARQFTSVGLVMDTNEDRLEPPRVQTVVTDKTKPTGSDKITDAKGRDKHYPYLHVFLLHKDTLAKDPTYIKTRSSSDKAKHIRDIPGSDFVMVTPGGVSTDLHKQLGWGPHLIATTENMENYNRRKGGGGDGRGGGGGGSKPRPLFDKKGRRNW